MSEFKYPGRSSLVLRTKGAVDVHRGNPEGPDGVPALTDSPWTRTLTLPGAGAGPLLLPASFRGPERQRDSLEAHSLLSGPLLSEDNCVCLLPDCYTSV